MKFSSKNKDAYYFSHDSNAKDDPKCVLLIEQLGLEGYGVFWVLIETLREQPDFRYPLKLIPALARRFNTTSEKMKAVIFSYELFVVENDTFFFSESLNRRMTIFLEKRKALSEAGKRGVEQKRKIAQKLTTLKPPLREVEASKANETNENKINKNILLEEAPVKRNTEGLERYLISWPGSMENKNAILEWSNYGAIGHPIWMLIHEITNSNGRITNPIAFILSRMKQ